MIEIKYYFILIFLNLFIIIERQSNVTRHVGAAKLIRESIVEQVKSKDGSVVLEFVKLGGFNWFFGASTTVLYSRFPHSENIYNKIKNSYNYHVLQSNNRSSYEKKNSRCLIIGQPGIGKSVSLNVYIRMAIKDGIDVIVETRSDRYFISKDSNDILEEPLGGTELIAYRSASDVLIFHDNPYNKDPPLLDNQGYVIAAVTPDYSSFSYFIKQPTLQLWMPLPTLSEIHAMNSLSPHPLSDEIITKRVETVGPLIRYVLTDEDKYNMHCEKMVHVAKNFSFSDDVISFLNTGYIPNNRAGLAWILFLIEATVDYRKPSKIEWVSNDIRYKALFGSNLVNVKKVEMYLLTTLDDPLQIEQPTGFYEYWVFKKLAYGDTILEPKSCVTNKPTDEIGPTTIRTVKISLTMPLTNRVLSIKDLKENLSLLFYPLKTGNPYVDAAALIKKEEGKFELLLFQATIGSTHKDISSVNKKRLNNKKEEITIINKAKKHNDIVSIRFIFIVPYLNKFVLSSMQKKFRPDGVSVEIAEMRPHLLSGYGENSNVVSKVSSHNIKT